MKHLTAPLTALLLLLPAAPGIAAPSHPADAVPVLADRWIEIDLRWFDRENMRKSAEIFWERYHPLFEGIQGWKGVILNVGWFGDYILLWDGNLEQKIPFPQNMRTDPQFQTQGALTGTSTERIRQWTSRFKEVGGHQFVNYPVWTYGELRELVRTLKDVAREKHRIDEVRVGSYVIGWQRGRAGSSMAEFGKNHPESLLSEFEQGRHQNFGAKLSGDTRKYGAFPAGIPDGTPFTEFYGKQWGDLSRKVGLDAIVFRDSFLGVGVYRREGPYGKVPPKDPEKVAAWSRATADLVKQTKTANPGALVIGYSSAASAMADWRVNCFDLEAISKEGFLDAWIDQTWAGSWNEAGQRAGGFWNIPALGWTYQLSYLLGHAALLADTKVHHYFLTETFDAWESWDIIHSARERLRWGIWAFSHAAVKTPGGLKMPGGSYISWANQGGKLLSEEDVRFLADTSNAAILDARETTKVFGPTLVYCRSAMEWQAGNSPAGFIKEWIDEQAGTLMKWAVPILSITRMEYLPSVESDMFLFQTPVHLSPQEKSNLINLLKSGKPVGVFASPAGGLDPDIAKILGVSTKDRTSMDNIKFIGTIGYRTDGIYQALPNTFPLFQPFTRNIFGKELEPVYSVSGSPCLGYNQSEGKQLAYWDPPEFSINLPAGSGDYGKSLDQILGSPTPYVLTARLINELLKKSGNTHISGIREYHPMTLAIWQVKDGGYRVLAGNLEEGINHSADLSSSAEIIMPQLAGRDKLTGVREEWSGAQIVVGDQENPGIPVRLEHGQTKLFLLK